MTPAPYTAAVIGLGRIGLTMEDDPRRPKPATHAAAYLTNPRTFLCGLCDTQPEALRRAETMYQASTYGSVAALLAPGPLDIVSVATPPSTHRAIVEELASAGVRAIVCEKPIAEQSEDGRAMVEACHKSGSLLFVNHSRRFDPELRALRNAIRAGALGAPRWAVGDYSAGLLNSGTHMIDFMRFCFGDIAWVSAFGRPVNDLDIDATVAFQNGADGVLLSHDVRDYAVFSLRLSGSQGEVLIDRFGYTAQWKRALDCQVFSGYRELANINATVGEPRSFLSPMVDHVVACLDGDEQPISTGEDGMAALQTIEDIYASAI